MIRVTIVGAGHYARSIVARKYAECPGCSLVGVISPRAPAERLHGTPLAGLPLVRNAIEWCALHGQPGEEDLFDLCVHPDAILPAMRPLVDCGARAFVLPKPLATTRHGLDELIRFVRAAGLWAAVASQWHYSRVTAMLREALEKLSSPLAVEAEFSQLFSADQLRHYTTHSALLPHMLQILHSAGLWSPDQRAHIGVKADGATALNIRIDSPSTGNRITLRTDLQATNKSRLLNVRDPAGSIVTADFLAIFRDGRTEKQPAIEINGHRIEILEDNILVMVHRHISGRIEGTPYLGIDSYLSVNEALVEIVEKSGQAGLA